MSNAPAGAWEGMFDTLSTAHFYRDGTPQVTP